MRPKDESRRVRRPRGYRPHPATGDWDYTADELQFMKAMQQFMRDAHRPFPTCPEVLEVLRSLGYRKVATG